MNEFPRTLIQIHYHNRIGGVSKVIGCYFDAFDRLWNGNSKKVFIGNVDPDGERYDYSTMLHSIPECDYRIFDSKEAFFATRDKLKRAIEQVFLDCTLPKPIAIVIHNATLGKNPALSASFTEIAKKYSGNTEQVRFFSVLHDFAEEGREEQLHALRNLEMSGIAIWDALYPTDTAIGFLVPNTFTRNLLQQAGLQVTYLPNPVWAGSAPLSTDVGFRRNVIDCLAELAYDEGICFDQDRPVVCYPARVISRKNVFEAIALAVIGLQSNLLLGMCGTKKADNQRCKQIKELVQRYKIPVFLDSAQIGRGNRSKKCGMEGNPIANLYVISEMIITTSIAEGFGYALYEPWMYGKAVFGRRPLHFSYIDGVDGSLLYDRLPVPESWVKVDDIIKKYENAYSYCFDRSGDRKKIESVVVQNGTVDYGLLDEDLQQQVIVRLLQSEYDRTTWLKLLTQPMDGWYGIDRFQWDTREIINRNRKQISRGQTGNGFFSHFETSLSSIPTVPPSEVDRSRIMDTFTSMDSFRLLLLH